MVLRAFLLPCSFLNTCGTTSDRGLDVKKFAWWLACRVTWRIDAQSSLSHGSINVPGVNVKGRHFFVRLLPCQRLKSTKPEDPTCSTQRPSIFLELSISLRNTPARATSAQISAEVYTTSRRSQANKNLKQEKGNWEMHLHYKRTKRKENREDMDLATVFHKLAELSVNVCAFIAFLPHLHPLHLLAPQFWFAWFRGWRERTERRGRGRGSNWG